MSLNQEIGFLLEQGFKTLHYQNNDFSKKVIWNDILCRTWHRYSRLDNVMYCSMNVEKTNLLGSIH